MDQVRGGQAASFGLDGRRSLDPVETGKRSIRWVPLILALEWTEANPDDPPGQPAGELVRRLFDKIARKFES